MTKHELIETLVKMGYYRSGVLSHTDLELKKIACREGIREVFEF